MRLAERTDYTLRVMLLTAADPNRPSVAPMTVRLKVTAARVASVVQLRKVKGWFETRCGRGGGVGLAVEPSKLTMGDIVRAIEPDFQLVECSKEESTCPLFPPCRLVGTFARARDAFVAERDAVTLTNLLKGRKRAMQSLPPVDFVGDSDD